MDDRAERISRWVVIGCLVVFALVVLQAWVRADVGVTSTSATQDWAAGGAVLGVSVAVAGAALLRRNQRRQR